MGYYIEVPENKGKAQQLVDLYGAEIMAGPPASFQNVPCDKALICVVDNGPFEAAALAYSKREFEAFVASDMVGQPDREEHDGLTVFRLQSEFQRQGQQRPRTWVLMDKTKAHDLAGYVEAEHSHR